MVNFLKKLKKIIPIFKKKFLIKIQKFNNSRVKKNNKKYFKFLKNKKLFKKMKI